MQRPGPPWRSRIDARLRELAEQHELPFDRWQWDDTGGTPRPKLLAIGGGDVVPIYLGSALTTRCADPTVMAVLVKHIEVGWRAATAANE